MSWIHFNLELHRYVIQLHVKRKVSFLVSISRVSFVAMPVALFLPVFSRFFTVRWSEEELPQRLPMRIALTKKSEKIPRRRKREKTVFCLDFRSYKWMNTQSPNLIFGNVRCFSCCRVFISARFCSTFVFLFFHKEYEWMIFQRLFLLLWHHFF